MDCVFRVTIIRHKGIISVSPSICHVVQTQTVIVGRVAEVGKAVGRSVVR